MHDDLYVELARPRLQDLPREVEPYRAARMARAALPRRRPWVLSRLGRGAARATFRRRSSATTPAAEATGRRNGDEPLVAND